ncbi:unnamed protein product, partial [Allacma fusca]
KVQHLRGEPAVNHNDFFLGEFI